MYANLKITHNMKFNSSLFAIAMLLSTALVWHGCEADVDLKNLDSSIDTDATIAMPIGSIKATINDFVGNGSWGISIDSLDNKGVLLFRDTISIARNFHTVELSQHISSTLLKMNVYDQLDSLSIIQDGKIIGMGVPIELEFPLTLKLKGINNDESTQRLDSAMIRNASFISNINQLGGMPLDWDWIDKVTLTMGDAFYRAGGNVLDIYTRGDGYGYGHNIPVNVDAFSINLMKNPNPSVPEQYSGNVIDSCSFKVTMQITVPAGEVVVIPPSSSFEYKLDVQFIDYDAIWGMFQPSSDMADANEISLSDTWGLWKLFESARLPFSEPKIDMEVTTHIAGALVMHGDYLYVRDSNGEQINATFDGKPYLEKHFTEGEYLGLDSEIGDSATMHVLFDKDPARGHIDQLFSLQPDYLGYKFSVDFDRYKTPQIRITNNTSIRIDAACELPFIFNEGVKVAYSDTIDNIDLSRLHIDSLISNIPELVDTIENASLTLALQIENSIPLQLKGSFACLDEYGNIILDPKTSEPWLITNQDTLLIPAPDHTFNYNTSTWDVTPQWITETITITKEEFDLLSRVSKIVFYAAFDDESLSHAYKTGQFNVKLTEHQTLCVKIGIGADIEAILNLGTLTGKE